MIVAWVFLAGYGLMSSRYFKGIYPDNKIRGLDFWFVVRYQVVLAWLLTKYFSVYKLAHIR